MKANTILITGAAGFAGSNLASKLLEENRDNLKLVLLYHFEKPPKYLLRDNVVAVKGSINDYNFMSSLISKNEVNVIFHLASNSIVRKCAADPFNSYLTNVMGTVTLFEAVRNVGMKNIRKIIISTSDKVYGHAKSPYNESTPFEPKYTYEATKACQDFVAQNYFHNYNLPINFVRSSNLYGPNDPNKSRLIPNTIRSINRNERPILHSGTKDYVREFVYISDFVDALLLIERKAKNGAAFCIGGTQGVSTIEKLIKRMCKLMDFNQGPTIVKRDDLFKEIKEQFIDAKKLKKLGWKPKYDLERGLLECIKSENYKN